MILLTIFSCLAKAESSVQTALKKEWDAIPQASKDEVLDILKATQVIKQSDTQPGEVILDVIAKATSQQFVDQWVTKLDSIAVSIGIEIPAGATNEQKLEAIVNNLTPRTGDNWGDTVLRIATYSLTNLIPGGVIVREVALPLIQWVYDNVFKPSLPA